MKDQKRLIQDLHDQGYETQVKNYAADGSLVAEIRNDQPALLQAVLSSF